MRESIKQTKEEKIQKKKVVPKFSPLFAISLSPTDCAWVSEDWVNIYYQDFLVMGTIKMTI